MAERHRCQVDLIIDEMVAAGKSEQDILTAIVAQYRPYHTLPAFDEGFNAFLSDLKCLRIFSIRRSSGWPVSPRGWCQRMQSASVPR